jgi:hypothetical protein
MAPLSPIPPYRPAYKCPSHQECYQSHIATSRVLVRKQLAVQHPLEITRPLRTSVQVCWLRGRSCGDAANTSESCGSRGVAARLRSRVRAIGEHINQGSMWAISRIVKSIAAGRTWSRAARNHEHACGPHGIPRIVNMYGHPMRLYDPLYLVGLPVLRTCPSTCEHGGTHSSCRSQQT